MTNIINLEPNVTSVYQVEIKQHNDWHFATCEGLPGLFVAHEKYNTVLNNIPEAMQMLIKHDCQEDVRVKEAPPKSPTLMGNKTYLVTTTKAAA